MTNYYVKLWDAESKVGSDCDWDDKIQIEDALFVRYLGKYKDAMYLRVPLFNEKGECVADTL